MLGCRSLPSFLPPSLWHRVPTLLTVCLVTQFGVGLLTAIQVAQHTTIFSETNPFYKGKGGNLVLVDMKRYDMIATKKWDGTKQSKAKQSKGGSKITK